MNCGPDNHVMSYSIRHDRDECEYCGWSPTPLPRTPATIAEYSALAACLAAMGGELRDLVDYSLSERAFLQDMRRFAASGAWAVTPRQAAWLADLNRRCRQARRAFVPPAPVDLRHYMHGI